jgi:hypothetical protein
MPNPFHLPWLCGWQFRVTLEGGRTRLEATGFGIRLFTDLGPGESPIDAADRLVLAEDRRRRSLHASWLRQVRGVARPQRRSGAADEGDRDTQGEDSDPEGQTGGSPEGTALVLAEFRSLVRLAPEPPRSLAA